MLMNGIKDRGAYHEVPDRCLRNADPDLELASLANDSIFFD